MKHQDSGAHAPEGGEPAAVAAARVWAAADPDPEGAAELLRLVESDPDTVAEMFAGRLRFGTAGIRGPLGVGPQRMNRVLVRSVAAAVARRVLADVGNDAGAPSPTVVIGHDARHHSDEFAVDSARVFAAHGLDVVLFDGVVPTPLVPFAVTRLGARAGVVVTASHNPAADSGYKVYWHDGAQIVPPVDAEISAEISARMDEVGPVTEGDLAAPDDPRIGSDDGTLREAYMAMATSLVGPPATPLTIVYTPVHGVGAPTLLAALQRVGHPRPRVVAEQELPDPDFPTAPFPNPEEPGVLDLAFTLANQADADLVLANDPDADRLAVGVPGGPAGQDGWQRLTGDDVGALLGDHLLATDPRGGPERLVVTTIVSSRLLGRIAERHGVRHATTLTGFKWIVRPGFADPTLRFVFGYEEALGYACTAAVPDKDGITAALVVADLAATLAADGRSLVDRLHALARRHGVHRTGQVSIHIGGAGRERAPDPLAAMGALMAQVRADPRDTIGGVAVAEVIDHLHHPDPSLRADVVVYEMAGGARVVVRPSGTEPKVKIYGEVVTDCGPDAAASFRAAEEKLADLLAATPGDLGMVAP